MFGNSPGEWSETQDVLGEDTADDVSQIPFDAHNLTSGVKKVGYDQVTTNTYHSIYPKCN